MTSACCIFRPEKTGIHECSSRIGYIRYWFTLCFDVEEVPHGVFFMVLTAVSLDIPLPLLNFCRSLIIKRERLGLMGKGWHLHALTNI